MTLTHDDPATGPARFRPRGQDDLAPSGTASRVAANLAALRLLRLLEREDRAAAPDEQAVLARWSGWGAVPQVFDDDRTEFAAARGELSQLLSETEYAAARRTTINAHYTDAALAKVVWDHVTTLGSGTGQVLEPGCGSGNFIGLAPPGARVLGVELDPVTAAVAARLYPDAEIRCESFADTRLPEAHFDLVVGNVPFSAAKLHDRRYNAAGHSMHNHFIIKSLKFLKPGCLLAVLTSRYTMDAQDPAAREEMAGLASLVTAVRLPSGAHRRAAGTEAVTDLLILRRTDPGTPGDRPQWRRSFETSLDGGTAWINEYWRDHPENVLGSFTVGQGQYNDHDLTVRPSGDLSGVASQLAVRLAARPVTVAPQEVRAGEADRFDGTLRANDDGSFSVLRDGMWQDWPCPATQAGELGDLLGLRDMVAALLDAEASSPDDTPAIAGLRAELNRRYDAYVSAHGPVNRTGWKRTGKTDEAGNDILARNRPPQGKFSEDPYAAAVYALEDFDPETGQAARTVIFTQRVVTTRQAQECASDPADAVAICMDQAGEVRIEDAARLLGSASADEARAALGELVYDEPGTGRLVPAAEYLSGKVRAKLREAVQAAEDDPRFDVNVAALRRVLPDDLGPGEIDARLGASWIDWRYVQQGLREILEDPRLKVEKGHGTSWTVTGDKTSVLATQVWGTEDKDAVTLAACLLEQRPVKVSPEPSERDDTPHDRHQKRLQAATATVTARAKADELNRRFGEWLWEIPARAADLVKTYNERFNSLVLRSYDGARPALPGLAAWFREWVHPHQLAAVARIINEPAVLLAHDVGAGKTAEMAMGAMELRRLGLANKPAIVIPNHMLEQFQREFLQLYPQARVLAAGSDDLKALGRHKFVARIATGNWDAVIMSQSVFERIPISAPEIERYIGAQLAGYDAWLERAREASQSKRMVKKMETRKLMREQRLRKKLDRARDGGISFEQTGIDYLFVDEAHHYKNLDIRSNNQELDIDGSGRASDLEMKLDYLRTTRGRRVVTFATATPIANSMTEAYVMCRYLRPDLLADAGIEDFDAWVGTFAATTTDVEVAPEGGIRVKDRFARFRNIPELLNMWRVAADVKTKEDLKLPVPELTGGKPEVVPVEPSEQLLAFMQNLASRAEAVRSRAVLPDEDNMLKISNDGRLAALDPRLAGLRAPETGKLDVAAQNIARIEHEYRGHRYHDGDGNLLPVTGSLQIVFCDLGTPGGKSRWNAYEYLRDKLAEYGTDPRTVRFMHEAKTDKAKAELFAAARAGKVAVLVGSTSLMGVGTNVQDLAVALHHLDCPWRPADVAQREGRILRQRNKHPRVHIYRYVTERSFDAYMWQTVTRKAKFIDQVIHGKTTSRDAEDIGGDMAALSYSEVTALATGDMRILAKAKADSDVRRLEDLESAWQRSRLHLKTKISDNQQSVARLTDVTAQLESAIGRRVDTRGDSFTMRLDGQAFSKRTDAAACLRSVLYARISQAKRGTRPRDDAGNIGTLGGFTVTCTPVWGPGDQVWAHLRFDGIPVPAVRISETELGLTSDKPPVGLITRLENKLADLGTDRDKATEEISRIQAETERAQTAIGAPFAHADELARARTQSDRLADELSGQPSAAPPPAPGPAPSETPDAGGAAESIAARTAEADNQPEHHIPPATEPASDRGTPVGSAGDTVRAGQAPELGTQASATGTASAGQVPSGPQPAPPGHAEPAEPTRQAAGASQPVPAPALAGTGSSESDAVVPEAAPAPAAHDPGHPADPDQPTAADTAGEAAAGLVIEHHQQSTLVRGTQKNDHQLRRMLHNHGFRWSGNLNAWFLPRPWTFSTRTGRVSRLTADLRQAHRPFTMRTQPPTPADTDDSPPEPLPAAEPYNHIREARRDHSEAVVDYWALMRTPAGNNVMSTYSGPGARPDAVALNAAYKAVRVSWDEAFAGDPQEVAGRFTAWVRAAAVLSRNLAAEQHRAPRFRQTLDTFISSATRLASRTQATAEDPVAWARVFADVPGNAPANRPNQEAAPPAPGASPGGSSQGSVGNDLAAGPGTVPSLSTETGPHMTDDSEGGPATVAVATEENGTDAAPANAPDQATTGDPDPGLSPKAAADDTAASDTAQATVRSGQVAPASPVGNKPGGASQSAATLGSGTRTAPGEPADAGRAPELATSLPTNSDLAAELRRFPGFARWLSLTGTPPAAGDLDAQRPGAGASAVYDTHGIEITVSGPDFTRHGLVTWAQAASWIDKGMTPARLGLVIIADRLSTFCRSHRDQLIAAGTIDPDAIAAELVQIRDTAVAMIVDTALRSRGAAKPVPSAGPDDPVWYTAAVITLPDRTAGKAENTALERLTRLRTAIREPQPVTATEIRVVIRRWTRHDGLPGLVRALDDPAAMRAWISEQASRRGEGQYDSSGERWYGSSSQGLITDRNGEDRAPFLIRWEEVPAWIQPGISSSQRDRLLAADAAATADARRRLTAAVHPGAGLTAPGEEESRQVGERLTGAADAVWAAIEAAPPPSPADLEKARYVYRDTGPVQAALFDDLQQDSAPTQGSARATAPHQPRPAPLRPEQDTTAKDQAAKPAVPDPTRASGMPEQDTTTAQVPAAADPASADDPEPPQTPATNSDLAIALHSMSDQELTSFLILGKTPDGHGSLTDRREGLPDAGASQMLTFDHSGVRITVSSRRFRRYGQTSWRQVASWIDSGLTPARLGIITGAGQLGTFTNARRDQLIATGKDNIDTAITELRQISNDAIHAALSAALSSRDADAPVAQASRGKPAYHSTAMLTGPDPSANPEENAALARIAELGAIIRGTQPVTPGDIRTAVRWWIGDNLPEYARALTSPEAMRGWIRRQASGPASRSGHGIYNNGRYYSASPEGLQTSQGSDTRIAPWIMWEEIPAWIQPGLSTSLRDRLIALAPRPAPGRTRATATSSPPGAADPVGRADEPLPRPLREAINAAWAAIEAAPSPSPGDLGHARALYRATRIVQQALPGSPAKADPSAVPTPRPGAEPRPASPSQNAPADHPQDELSPAATTGVSVGTGAQPGREPASLPQPAATPDPLTDDDTFLGISRLPAFVIGDLFHAIDTSQALASVSRLLAPHSGERAAGEPDPGAREAVTPEPAGLRIQIDHAGSRRTGVITWRQVDDLLRPGTTPTRLRVVTQAWQVRVGFMSANASFRAVGEGSLAAAAEDELRGLAQTAVTAIIGDARTAAAGQAAQPAVGDSAALERISALAAALPARPTRQSRPVSSIKTGNIIGHPGYKLQPFRVAAPPRRRDDGIEVVGRLTAPGDGEPAGQITFILPADRNPDPVVSLIPLPRQRLQLLFLKRGTEGGTAEAQVAALETVPVASDPQDGAPHMPADSLRQLTEAMETGDLPTDSGEASQPATPAETAPANPTPAPDAVSPTEEKNTMPSGPEARLLPPPSEGATPQARSGAAEAPADVPVASVPPGQASAETGRQRPRPAARTAHGADLLGELDDVLNAIVERRRSVPGQSGEPRDDFSDIRSAFSLLRSALDLGTSAGPAAGYGRYPVFAAGPVLSRPAPRPARISAPGDGQFGDIRAAFADLRRDLGLPASDGPSASGARLLPDQTVGRMLDEAVEEAQACVRWYGDTPEWQRITTVGRAAQALITAIRDAARDYWAEISQDIRLRGFARTLASRVCRTVAYAAGALAGRIERAGRGGTRPAQAARGLQRAAAVFADRIIRYPHPQTTDQIAAARRVVSGLGARQRNERPPAPKAGGSSSSSASPANPATLAFTNFTERVPRPAAPVPGASARRASRPAAEIRGTRPGI